MNRILSAFAGPLLIAVVIASLYLFVLKPVLSLVVPVAIVALVVTALLYVK